MGFGPGSGFDVAGFGGCEADGDGYGVAVDQVEGRVQGVFGVEGVGVGDVFGAGADAGDAFDGVGSDGFVLKFQGEQVEAAVVFEEVQGADFHGAGPVGVKGVVGDDHGGPVQDRLGEGFDDLAFSGVALGTDGLGNEDPLETGQFKTGFLGHEMFEFGHGRFDVTVDFRVFEHHRFTGQHAQGDDLGLGEGQFGQVEVGQPVQVGFFDVPATLPLIGDGFAVHGDAEGFKGLETPGHGTVGDGEMVGKFFPGGALGPGQQTQGFDQLNQVFSPHGGLLGSHVLRMGRRAKKYERI